MNETILPLHHLFFLTWKWKQSACVREGPCLRTLPEAWRRGCLGWDGVGCGVWCVVQHVSSQRMCARACVQGETRELGKVEWRKHSLWYWGETEGRRRMRRESAGKAARQADPRVSPEPIRRRLKGPEEVARLLSWGFFTLIFV